MHFVDEVYDQGPILQKATVPVLPDDTPASLAARVLEQVLHSFKHGQCSSLHRGTCMILSGGSLPGADGGRRIPWHGLVFAACSWCPGKSSCTVLQVHAEGCMGAGACPLLYSPQSPCGWESAVG